MTPTSSVDSYLSSNSLQFGVAGLGSLPQRSLSQPAEVKSAEANYGEGSGPNKRPREEEPVQQTRPQQVPQQVPRPLPYQNPMPFQPQQNPGIQPQPHPGLSQQPSAPTQQNTVPFQSNLGPQLQQNPGLPQSIPPGNPTFPFQTIPQNQTKQKAKKRVGKRAEPQPLVGLMNEQGSFDAPVLV